MGRPRSQKTPVRATVEVMSTDQSKIPWRTHAILISVILVFIAAALCYTFEAAAVYWAIPGVLTVALIVLIAQWNSARQGHAPRPGNTPRPGNSDR